MHITENLLEVLAQKYNRKLGVDLACTKNISVLGVHPDCINGALFWVLLDGQTKSEEIRTQVK